MKRRLAMAAMLAGLGSAAASTAAVAQEAYPTRAVRIVVGFPAGSATDITTRIYAEKLSAHFNQSFIVENMPGAAANLAAAHVARGPADGYTLYVSTNANSISVHLYRKLNYRFPDDFVPIATMVSVPTIMAASPQFKPSTVKEVIALAKEKPGEVTYGSAGVGTGPQLAGELFVAMSQIKLTHVPYKGTNEALGDLMTGRISLLFAALPVVSRPCPRRPPEGAGHHHRPALGPRTRHPDDRRVRLARFRRPALVRSLGPARHTRSCGPCCRRGDRKHPERGRHPQAPRRRRCRRPDTNARRFREVHRCRHPEMGEGGGALWPEDRLARPHTTVTQTARGETFTFYQTK